MPSGLTEFAEILFAPVIFVGDLLFGIGAGDQIEQTFKNTTETEACDLLPDPLKKRCLAQVRGDNFNWENFKNENPKAYKQIQVVKAGGIILVLLIAFGTVMFFLSGSFEVLQTIMSFFYFVGQFGEFVVVELLKSFSWVSSTLFSVSDYLSVKTESSRTLWNLMAFEFLIGGFLWVVVNTMDFLGDYKNNCIYKIFHFLHIPIEWFRKKVFDKILGRFLGGLLSIIVFFPIDFAFLCFSIPPGLICELILLATS